MKAITFKANGKRTDKPAILASAVISTQDGKTFVKFSNPAISQQLVQIGVTPSNDNPRKVTLAKDYLFEVEVEN